MARCWWQWQREIERFTHERATIIAGPVRQRREQYLETESLFKISNYEAVLRDGTIIGRFRPDLIIFDEAQRIKNFETKTAEAVKRLPRQHVLILTGTPLENKLEDVYSIVQFLDPELLSPLWRFAAEHFLLSRHKKDKILGYRNLDKLHARLQPLVIRRHKEEVLEQLPEQVRTTISSICIRNRPRSTPRSRSIPAAPDQQKIFHPHGPAPYPDAAAEDAPGLRLHASH